MKTANGLALILILAASSMLWVESASAQSIQAPSVPEFTVKQVDQSYDVAPSTTTNPYTGEPTTNPGYHVKKLCIEVTIKNQPFTAATVKGNTVGLFYNVEAKANKPHYTSGADNYDKYAIIASSEEYTVITIPLGAETDTWNILPGTQVDFKVQAVRGYSNYIWGPGSPESSGFTLLSAGDWSNTQTITITDGNTTPEPTTTPPTPAPTVTATPAQIPTETPAQAITQNAVPLGLSWEQIVIAVMAAVIAVFAVGLTIIWRKLPRK